MKAIQPPKSLKPSSRAALVYELLVWIIYVCIYKYAYYLENSYIPRMRMNFPFPQIILYALASSVYVIPFYRWLGPWLLHRYRYVALFFITIFYFAFFSKLCNWGVSALFYRLNTQPALNPFYQHQYLYFNTIIFSRGIDIPQLLVDLLAFMSILLMRYGLENERKKYALENDNLALQLETLKAQLQPHFLFNTLNSIYGMSLANAADTPAFILRLSDMMRYILYDCRQHQVPLEKDMQFLDNYLEMERKRYPEANIDFTIAGDPGSQKIAPLLFIQFIENSFKHGAYRLHDKGFVKGSLEISRQEVRFFIANDIFITTGKETSYGGIGIENVQKRLQMYYPGKHRLDIKNDGNVFAVDLKIHL